jgi:hypothetical protein
MKSRRQITIHIGSSILETGGLLVALGLLYAVLVTLPTYYLWNWLMMPAIFGTQKITFWQALGAKHTGVAVFPW